MESKCTRFRARIIHVAGMEDETGHTCDCDHVTVILLDHCRQEFTDHPEVRHGVDFKGFADKVF